MGWVEAMTLIETRNDALAGRQYIVLNDTRHERPISLVDRPDARVGGSRRRSLESITGMLDRMGCGYLVLDRDKKVIEWNAAARDTLARQGEATDTAVELAAGLRRLVANVPVHLQPGSLSWVVIHSRGDRPVTMNETGVVTPDGTTVVALLDRDNKSAANPRTLQRLVGLTSAETQLALRLAHGDAPLEIARSWHLSRTTIRSQLASLFAKTDTRRQAELVALLGRISVLP